jgi:predicted DNA binding CopG/RHH family protein
MNQKSIPHFTSETEEAQWWYEQRDQLTAKTEEAANRGELRLRHLSPAVELAPAPKSVTLHLSEQDLLRARKLAEKQGLQDEVYLAILLHGALDTEEADTK